MKIIFVSEGKYPDQHAAAIRHSTLVQGIKEEGHDVVFFVLSPQGWKDSEYIFNGVNFLSLNNYHGSCKVLKRAHYYKSIIALKRKILDMHRKDPVDAMVVFSTNNRVIKTLLDIRNRNKIKLFHERTELPYVFRRTETFYGKLKYKKYLNTLIPEFDGIFVISNKLKEFFFPFNQNICKIPTVVDFSFFNKKAENILNFKYIAYCGNMSGTKDGLPLLVESFAKLTIDFPKLKLLLIGDTSDKIKINQLLNLIELLGIKDKVEFTGLIERDEMPKLLNRALLLVVSKPNTEQNSGNFPIKIGEYLATGVPIVCTKVGEIPNFITDGINGFLAEPDSVESFYYKMKEALLNYEQALKIGLKGQLLAKTVFNYKIQADNMLSYMSKIIKKI